MPGFAFVDADVIVGVAAIEVVFWQLARSGAVWASWAVSFRRFLPATSVSVCQTAKVLGEDAASVVRRHVDAFNARDLDTLMAGFTEDALWVTGTSIARGRVELAELFAGAMNGLLPKLVIQNLLMEGDQAACQMTETLEADGEERTFFIAGFYRLRGGRIASAKIYREGSAEIA